MEQNSKSIRLNYLVYSLADPRTDKIRYVGITSNINRRLYQHRYWAKNSKRISYVYNWINELLSLGLEFKVGILEKGLSQEKAFEREIYWISKFDNLTNLDGGGKGFGAKNQIWKGRKHSEETKEKIKQSNLGKTASVTTKLKISKSKKPKLGNPNYKSKNDRGNKSKQIKVYCAETEEIIHNFSSILECSKVLNLNRTQIKRSMVNNKSYKNFKFEINGTRQEKI